MNNQDQALDQNHNILYLYVNPVTVERSHDNKLNPSSTCALDTTHQNITSCLHNGDAPQRVSPEVKGPTQDEHNKDVKYKRPPPRPPSLGSGSGMGLLFSSTSLPHTSSSVTTAAEKKEEGRRGGGEREERKSMFTSPQPSRPPALLQCRAAPPLPPAPLLRTSSRKSTDQEVGEGTGREKGHTPAKTAEKEGGDERGEEIPRNKSGQLDEVVEQQNSSRDLEEEEVKKDREKKEIEDEKEIKEVTMNKEEDKQISSSQCLPLPTKPTRPVPPPRRKPADTHLSPGGLVNQSVAKRAPPPPVVRRPDVSLYSPQGGAAVGTDPDSCSSSTEEEAETNQDQEQTHR